MRRVSAIGSLLVISLALASAPKAQALVWPDVPERVERQLASPDPSSRRAAARELASLGPSRGAALVLRALGDADVEVRLAAAHSAIRLRAAGAPDIALQWLGEREAHLRIAACEVALAVPSARSVQPLARALGDSDPLVRAACADALGATGSAEAVAPLSGKLDDPTPAVRGQVARALAKLGDARAVVPLVGKVQDSVPDVRQAVVRALGDLGDARATQALLLALRDNVPEVKIEALAALGRLRAPEAASTVAPLALERNAAVRQAALVTLGRIKSPEAVRALARSLGTHDDATGSLDPNPVRDALVAAGPPAIAELTAILERPASAAVATSAAWVLGELRATTTAPSIVAALRKGALPPAAALRALAGAGTPAEVPVVLEFVSDPSQVVRDEALRAATALLDPAQPDGRAVEPLAATLKNPRTSPQERAGVARLLGRTGAPRAAAELASLVSAKDTTLRLAAIDALGALGAAAASPGGGADDALLPLVSDPDPAIRVRAAIALATSGGARARDALLAKLDGGEDVDRFAVLSALGGILERHPDEASTARLFRELSVAAGPERDALLEAAGRARLASVVHALGDLAQKGDLDDRRTIAEVLGAHRGSAQALAIARALAKDAAPSVRAQAASALGLLGDEGAVGELALLARSADLDVATNAAGALARIAAAGARSAAISVAACPLLGDGRATVRANALVALAAAKARCGDGRAERKLALEDPSDLARGAAARLLASASPAPQGAEDRATLDRCAMSDRSAEVARSCRLRPSVSTRAPRAVTIFVVGDNGGPGRPHAAFLVQYEGGLLRAGTADRRGATFDPSAPAGDVMLRRPQGR